jgi:putative hydrolase of the HAD superfamily
VGLDGDDTLWHNETRFNLIPSKLRDLLHPNVPDADVDRHLPGVEMRNLGMYGYGVKRLVDRPLASGGDGEG